MRAGVLVRARHLLHSMPASARARASATKLLTRALPRARALAWTLPRPQQFLDVVQGAVDTEENGQFECGSDPADNILGTPEDQVVAGINYKVGCHRT